MPWQTAEFPRRPQGESRVVTVADAYVTRLRRGTAASTTRPRRWMRGAVHDAKGRLVPESQRVWGLDAQSPIATDPRRVKPKQVDTELEGTWVYGGHFMPPFGHFLVETLTNLWVDRAGLPEQPVGIVFHQGYRTVLPRDAPQDRHRRPWQDELIELAGYGGCDLHEVSRRPVRVERLVVPTRPVVFKNFALPEAVEVWQRVARAAGPPGDDSRVFLSRTSFNQSLREAEGRQWKRSDAEWDQDLDAVMAELGFRVVEPQTLPIREQIRLVHGADVVAGPAGSALHLSAFARPETRVVEIGDRRTPRRRMPAQLMIDAAYVRETAFIPNGAPEGIGSVVAALLS